MIEVTEEDRIRAVERSRRMYQTDLQSNLATARDRGRKEKSFEIARNLMQMGFSLEQISEATGLSPEEVNRLRAEN